MAHRTARAVLGVALVLLGGGLAVATAPVGNATVCGSIGGRHIDVSGCSDPFSYLNEALAPPPPPPPPGEAPPPPPPPPPPPAPNVNVCANIGKRISVSGCI